MSTPTLFVDRDGTLIEEPPDDLVDSLRKVRFMPGVFAALGELTRHGFHLVMVTNQESSGTTSFPGREFEETQGFILDAFRSQGISFDAVFVWPSKTTEACHYRNPLLGLVEEYLTRHHIDRSRSAVVGDRDADLKLAAQLGIRGFTVRHIGAPEHTWLRVSEALLARRAQVRRHTSETRVLARVNLDSFVPVLAATGIGFFDHMLE